jgi:hypothetical protein
MDVQRDSPASTLVWKALKDQILFAGGDTNLYSYASNDPVNSVDAEGERNNNANSGVEITFINLLKENLTPGC